MSDKTYIAIDLKSFYASVECVDRSLDPLDVNLVVADESRTEKTICLAVSPALKAYGIPGRARLFEVVQRIKEVNNYRRSRAAGHELNGSSFSSKILKEDESLQIDYIVAPPRMSRYMQISTQIYGIYMKYVAPEDVHVYSVDEVFIDVTAYLKTYKMTPHEMAITMIRDVLRTTGITATAGIGTNLFLAKVAMDVLAKKMPADEDGVRIAELDEMSYRRELWGHRPITDIWRVGKGTAKRLAANGMFTMGDVARCSAGSPKDHFNEDLLYRLFGINAELLIDHAWGYEPVTIADIKAYVPESNSVSEGQVLKEPYTNEKAKLVIREMTDNLVLDLVKKDLVTDQMVINVGYDIDNLKDPEIMNNYRGEVSPDYYGRMVPKPVHGSINLKCHTSSTRIIMEAVTKLFEDITDEHLFIRRMSVCANHVIRSSEMKEKEDYEQLELFVDYEEKAKEDRKEKEALEREKRMQKAILKLKDKYGKNAVLRGMDLEEGATKIERNSQVGGHKA
ncbi:MAG: DNA methylase [Lachnospiraceae bacterium]|nr:DNA methylase [Lachnospiraceae bacterium]